MERNLYQLVAKAKREEASMEFIVNLFEPKIKKVLNQTRYQEREDLKQELMTAIILIVKNYDLKKSPGFFEFKEQLQHY